MRVIQLQHIALPVADVEASVHFYGEVLGLERLVRPAFDFPGAWFRLGVAQELHLIGGRTFPVNSSSRSHHFALEVNDIQSVAAEISQKGIVPVKGPKQRPDGAWQLFLADPDGHVIEFCQLPLP